MRFTIAIISLIALERSVLAGPIAWGLCQTACNAGWGSCCIGAGGIAGVVAPGLGIGAALAGCSANQGVCMAACTPLLLAPGPMMFRVIVGSHEMVKWTKG